MRFVFVFPVDLFIVQADRGYNENKITFHHMYSVLSRCKVADMVLEDVILSLSVFF